MGADDPLRQGDGGGRVGHLDDEADRAEALFHVGLFIGGIAGQQHRGAHLGSRELGVLQGGGSQHHLAQRTAVGQLDALGGIGGLDRAQHGVGHFGLGQEALDGLGQVGAELVIAPGAVFGLDATGRHEDGLGGGAHLAGVQGQGEGQVAQHRLVGVGGVDDDVVHASQLGIHLGLTGVVDEPLAEHVAAGEIHRLDRRVGGQGLGGGAFVGNAQADQVGVDAVLGQHGADGAHGDGGRQDGVAVGLDDHRVAGGQRREEARIGVPGGEGAAAHHQADAAADDLEVLLHDQGRVLALGLFPHGLGGHEALFAPGVGHGLEAAILGVGRASLKGHHPALAGGHHHRVGQLEALLVEAVEDLQTDAGATIGTHGLPALHGLEAGGDQGFRITHRIAHVQGHAVGRGLTTMPAAPARLTQFERLAQMGFEGALAVIGSRLAVELGAGHLGESRPVAAGGDGTEGALQGGAMLLEQGVSHCLVSGWVCSPDANVTKTHDLCQCYVSNKSVRKLMSSTFHN